MKARKLKQRLDTDMIVSNHPECIAVGNHCCLKMICVDKSTLTLSYAFDPSGMGRDSLYRDQEKLKIWDTLAQMILDGEIDDYLRGKDEIEPGKQLEVFTVRDGELVETITDAYGFPNITIEGDIMYPDRYFSTPQEAIRRYVQQYHENIEFQTQLLEAKQQEVRKIKYDIRECFDHIAALQAMFRDMEQQSPTF